MRDCDCYEMLGEIFENDKYNYTPLRECYCHLIAIRLTAKTDINPGRRFYKCGNKQFLKDMLKDLCVYNKGSNQGSYELKPEYKKSSE